MNVDLPIADIVRCSQDALFVEAVANLYEQLDEAIGANDPVCVNRGSCCRFESFGHNLFVTSVEVAYFLAGLADPPVALPDRSGCPYQEGGRCSVRANRPAGCRIFHCEPGGEGWQSRLTEDAIERLAGIGERFDLPYAYLEWTDALRGLVALPRGRNASGRAGGSGSLWPTPESPDTAERDLREEQQ